MSLNLSSTPIAIVPTTAELRHRSLSQRNLEIAIRALSRDGLVVLKDTVDHAVLDRLNKKMVQDAYELQARKNSPFNYNKGNIQQDPPMTEKWFSNEIYISECQHSMLGGSLTSFLSGLLTSGRSYRHSGHLNRAGSSTISAVRIRQHCSSPD
jgi:hypothetical protein